MLSGYSYTNSFSDRLTYLYAEKDIDVHEDGWSLVAAGQMMGVGESAVIQYNNLKDTESDTVENLQRKERRYTAHTLRAHLKIDTAANVSGLWLSRYCKFFGCSAAFLFGEIDLPTIEQTDICKVTGLTPVAVNTLIADHKEALKRVDSAAEVDSSEVDDITKAQLKEIFLASRKYTNDLSDVLNFLLTKKHTAPGCLLDLLYSFFDMGEDTKVEGLKDNTITIQHRRGFYVNGAQLMTGVLYDRIRETLFEYRKDYQSQKKKSST